tara:strand:+ start:1392 stop:1622 length:231 start_codon:yes stop_codon:yes gene_type:complete
LETLVSEIMGFHKRWINIDQIKLQYSIGGIDAVKNYLDSPDALIITDDESSDILDKYRDKVSDQELDKTINKYICI